MIQKLFEQIKPAFLQHRNRRLLLDGHEYESLDVTIREIVPVRKLFTGNKLTCWSVNGSPGREKRLCAFCPDTGRCQKRLRLNLIVRDDSGAEVPAVLEIRTTAFDALDAALEATTPGPDAWRDILFRVRATTSAKGFDDLAFDRIF